MLLICISNTASAAPFTDVPTTHPYYKSIDALRQQRVFRGYEDGKFYPNISIARIEFTHALVTALFTEEEITACDISAIEKKLTDMDYNSWYGQTLCIAQTQSIIGGYPDNTFKAEQAVNFAEAATILVRAYSVLQSINHANEDPIWYRPYIKDMSILQAIPPTITGPDHFARRGEIAEMMYRLQAIANTGQTVRRTFIEASEFSRGTNWESYIATGRQFTMHYPSEWPEPYRVKRPQYWNGVPTLQTVSHTYLGPKPICKAQQVCIERPYIFKEYAVDQWPLITEELLSTRGVSILVDETTNGVQMVIFEEETEDCTDRTVFLKSRRFLYSMYAECAGSSQSKKRMLQLLVESLQL